MTNPVRSFLILSLPYADRDSDMEPFEFNGRLEYTVVRSRLTDAEQLFLTGCQHPTFRKPWKCAQPLAEFGSYLLENAASVNWRKKDLGAGLSNPRFNAEAMEDEEQVARRWKNMPKHTDFIFGWWAIEQLEEDTAFTVNSLNGTIGQWKSITKELADDDPAHELGRKLAELTVDSETKRLCIRPAPEAKKESQSLMPEAKSDCPSEHQK